MTTVLDQIKAYVFQLFHEDATGHDFEHMKRVATMARKLAEEEGADSFIAEAAGWLHDVGDRKLFRDPDLALQKLTDFLSQIDLSEEQFELIDLAMKDVSFSKGKVPETLEGKIVQDADRLDAIGAIGIARTFAYGGSKGTPLFSEDQKVTNTSVQHFYDKLLHLRGKMNTNAAKKIATKRHQYMEAFLECFYDEWYMDRKEGR
ncbi:HD domain-containing protein [Aquibacillus koreensis]|uniref:HD domain-containing protein n=1 Tax=Aquibacillus koreensis TaxID=279446 RepID=A0A9X3WHW4_9BACI|nr:HD domain-containing protein [Aquibacillus koreensis]MCT2537324.1 HD domain-containing protein [Aquibacillus koreensis]MDC3418770.1 HD domain-containing protein [Aquibacillus koreensis]